MDDSRSDTSNDPHVTICCVRVRKGHTSKTRITRLSGIWLCIYCYSPVKSPWTRDLLYLSPTHPLIDSHTPSLYPLTGGLLSYRMSSVVALTLDTNPWISDGPVFPSFLSGPTRTLYVSEGRPDPTYGPLSPEGYGLWVSSKERFGS